MNIISRYLQATSALVVFLSITSGLHAAERFHLEPALPSEFRGDASGVGSVAGGNVNTAATAPRDDGGFRLVESSIGYLGPTLEGAPGTRDRLNEAAAERLTQGTPYKQTGIPGNWQIVFPGVVDVSTGGPVTGNQNFYADRVQSAVEYYRAVGIAFPNDVQAKISFINALREIMAPYAYAGNNAYARATRERIILGPSDPIPPVPGQPDQANPTATSREEAVLNNACGMYELAAAHFAEMMGAGDSVEIAFPSSLPPGVTESSAEAVQLRAAQRLLCSTYARAIGFKGETLLRSFQLRYFQKYKLPTISASIHPDIASLITALDTEARRLDYYLLQIAPLQGNSWFPAAEFAPAESFLSNLRDLRSAMRDASLTFAGLDSSLNIKANAYGPDYIPFFFDPFIFPGAPTTFKGLSDFARPLAVESENSDAASSSAVAQVDLNLQSLAQRLNDINDQFNSQLGQLCGWKIVDVNGVATRTPDIDGAILPPERRAAWQQRNRADQGEIGLQWREIDAAELALDKALLDLQNVLSVIDQKRATWQLIKASREVMIQNVILGTGEKIDQLNKDAIEAKAKFAEYQARQAKKKRKRGLISGIVGVAAIVAAPFTAGASLSVAVASLATTAAVLEVATAIAGVASDYAAASREIKDIRTAADLERKIGEINAKKEELAYLEKAGIQFQGITEDGYRTEEAIHSLLLEVKSAEIQIEMAELRVDREYAKLSTMLGRVSYLMQQHAASFSLVNTNPLNSADFRLVRDRSVREAEERFIFAQEWAFLTGRAASYVALGSQRRANIEGLNAEILKARTGKRLKYLLDRIAAEMNFVTFDLGSRTPTKVSISLRDYIFQHNNVIRDNQGEPVVQFPFPWEAQPVADPLGNINAAANQTSSDKAWAAFLNASYSVDPVSRVGKLTIPFRLSLNRWADADSPSRIPDLLDRLENPLFSANQLGSLIFFSATNQEFFGTQIDVQGRDITGINPANSNITATLSPEGASYIRERSYINDPDGSDIRVFQFGSNRTAATIQSSLNGLPVGLRNPQLNERSPANDRWVLTIFTDTTPNRILVSQRDKIKDIRLTFSISSFTE